MRANRPQTRMRHPAPTYFSRGSGRERVRVDRRLFGLGCGGRAGGCAVAALVAAIGFHLRAVRARVSRNIDALVVPLARRLGFALAFCGFGTDRGRDKDEGGNQKSER